MNHPPIPPKSRRFWISGNGCVYFVIWVSQGFDIKEHCELTDCDRELVASYCEVEWTKRAERWNALRAKEYLKTPAHCMSDRMEYFCLMDEYCIRNARAWRAWATRPKTGAYEKEA